MASRIRQPAPAPRDGELPEEFQLRRLVARHRLRITKAALKKEALGTYAAADTGRRNRDWKANNGSADLAIIPDSLVLLGRARQLCRDSWVAKSIQKAFVRNVVGKGITVIPHAKDRDGKPLVALNRAAQAEWNRWAKNPLACDVEKRKTYPQMMRLAAEEQVAAGEHLQMWSYAPPIGPDGKIDRNQPVGLRLQGFEPEQLDLRILSFEGREVRGGVEVDENGAPIAYHLYTRNPNDVLYRHAFFSERVPRARMLHYFKQERVLQTRGVSRLAPVMQDIRDLERFKSATLTRAMMEACIGVIIKTLTPVQGMGGIQSTLPPAPGDAGQTNNGMTEADFVPGMVANLQPGEDASSFVPQTPGNQYDPFTNLTVRGIGAGVGMSFGQVMRQSDGNYSSARQDMLEDRREQEPEQELIVDCLERPTYEKFFHFAAHEGRFDGVDGFDMDEYLSEQHRYVEADYIPPPQTWIDPEKEANAFAILLKNNLITREEIVAMRGGRFWQVIEKRAAETQGMDDLGLVVPENAEERTAIRELVKAMLSNRLGTIDNVTANGTDIAALLGRAGIPTRDDVVQPLLPIVSPQGALVTGDPVKNKEGETIGGGVQQPAPASPAPDGAPDGAIPSVKPPIAKLDGIDVAPTVASPLLPLPVLAPPSNVPHYRRATDAVMSCATCSYASGERCTRFNFTFDPAYVCDDWAAKTITENIGAPNTAKTFPPGPQPGERPLERRFFPDADATPRP